MTDKRTDSYRLQIRVEIERLESGYTTSERLGINECITFEPTTFLDVLTILARFHELSQAMRNESETVKECSTPSH